MWDPELPIEKDSMLGVIRIKPQAIYPTLYLCSTRLVPSHHHRDAVRAQHFIALAEGITKQTSRRRHLPSTSTHPAPVQTVRCHHDKDDNYSQAIVLRIASMNLPLYCVLQTGSEEASRVRLDEL